MNKIFYIKLILPLLLISSLISCNLERFPYDSIETSQSFKTIKDAKNWDNGIYAYLRGRVYGGYMYSQDVQVDLLNATLDFGNRNGTLHRWSSFLADDYTISGEWLAYYNAIANINLIIKQFDGMKLDAADQKTLDVYKGDAYFARAYYYNELALRWSKAYNPSTAGTDLAVPLVLEYDVNAKPSRATLKDVYSQILSDIAQAKTLLAGVEGKSGATKFTIDAVTALEARVKLYMKDWAGAYTAANSLISSKVYPLITDSVNLKKMWVNDFSQEVIMQCFVDKPSELANANDIYLGFNGQTQKYTPDFVPEQWVIDMYSNNDFRKNIYFAQKPCKIGGNEYSLTLMNKFPGNPALFTSTYTNYQQTPKVFRIAEMYLIAAEAAANGGSSTANALNALNSLRQARGLAAVNVTGDDLTKEIRDERFRELAFEGFRLFDLKRWNLGFERKTPQSTEALLGKPLQDFYGKKVNAGDNKFVWGLPTNDITINPNLKGQQNPGW